MNLLASPRVQNIGALDRAVRALIALALLILALTPSLAIWLQISLIVLAVIFAVSSYMGHCFIYKQLGWCSCENGKPIIHRNHSSPKVP